MAAASVRSTDGRPAAVPEKRLLLEDVEEEDSNLD
jgi:hypothetical protein